MTASPNPRSQITRRLAIGMSGIAAVGAAFWLWRITPFPFEEKYHHAEPGSLAFSWFVANEFIEHVPLVPDTKDVRFGYIATDVGHTVGLSYLTSASEQRVKEELAGFMRKWGFHTSSSHDKNEAWAEHWTRNKDGARVLISLHRKHDGEAEVHISHFRIPPQ